MKSFLFAASACGSSSVVDPGDETTFDLDSTGALSSSGEGEDEGDTTTADETTTEVDTTGASADESTSSATGSDNDAPVTVDDAYLVAVGEPLFVLSVDGVLANDMDPDGDGLEVVEELDLVTANGAMVELHADGSFTYVQPPPPWWGEDEFGYDAIDSEGNTASGHVRVVVPPALIPLADVADGTGGFTLDGAAAGDYSGMTVRGVGDVNGDGLADVMVNAWGADPNGAESGRSYVVFGKADTESIDLGDVIRGAGGFAIQGTAAGDHAGISLNGAGDVNGDGLADVIVGSIDIDVIEANTGRSYVVFGKADTTTVELIDVVNGIGGFALDGVAESDFAGVVNGAGDVDGDGLDDLIVGAWGVETAGDSSGRSYVVFGKTDTELVDLADIVEGEGGFAIDGEAGGDLSGWSVSGAGDVDGDGLADVIIGAWTAAPSGLEDSGRSYVVFGKSDHALVQLADVTAGVGGFAIDGAEEEDRAGTVVSGAGDVNGDGLADVIIGAPWASADAYQAGRGYVVFGKADTDSVALADVASGDGGFVLRGVADNDFTGAAIAGAGDVNGDGLADVVVGVGNADFTGEDAGRTYVVFGKADTDAVVLTETAMGHGGFALDGIDPGDYAGWSASGAGDVDGDGLADIIIGGDFGNGDMSGRAYVVFAAPFGL